MLQLLQKTTWQLLLLKNYLFIIIIIYLLLLLFILAVLGLHCTAGTSHCGGASTCRVWALGMHAQWLRCPGLVARGMWDLPGPGIKLMSPALAGGFLTI